MLKLIKEQFYKENTIHVANLWLANLADECLLFIINFSLQFIDKKLLSH